MTLDLSAYAQTTDSPELAAFKKKVKDTAEKYARRNSWCGEVKKALKELGIEDVKPISIQVTTTHPFTFNVKIDPTLLVGLDDAKQREVVAKKIGDVSIGSTGDAKVSGKITITADTIASMQITPKGSALDGNWAFVSREGRATHLITSEPGDPNNRGYSSTSCTYFLCGESIYGEAPRESARSTGAQCKKCVAAAENLQS